MPHRIEHTDLLIIGAGPAGSVAAGLLRGQGREVLMLEKEQFPRFSIGESLLPQSMEYIEAAGMLRAVVEAGFQYKNGAAFAWGGRRTHFDFRQKFSEGWSTTYQVQRADFDKVLADEAQRLGATVRYRHEVLAVDVEGDQPRVTVRSPEGETYEVVANFLLSPLAQARKQDPRYWGSYTVLDLDALGPADRALFQQIPHAPAAPDPEELGIPLPEPHPSWMERIETEWQGRYAR